MDAIQIVMGILVWLAVIGIALFLVPGGGGRAQIGTWLILTTLTIGVEFIVLFLVSYGLLFAFGKEAAGVGVLFSFLLITATPVIWAVILRRRARHGPPGGTADASVRRP